MTLTIELPEQLNQQFKEHRVPEKEIKAIVLAALEIWLAERQPTGDEKLNESAVPFAQRLIAQNRELFQRLAQR